MFIGKCFKSKAFQSYELSLIGGISTVPADLHCDLPHLNKQRSLILKETEGTGVDLKRFSPPVNT